MSAYYNEIDAYAAQWLRNLIVKDLIAKGDVDERSICDVDSADLKAYRQCHFFAGIGGWSHALRLAGWPDDRPIWTGSCPCQPFSVAGKGAGIADPRHLWPDFRRLIAACRPPVVMGEQVAGKAGYGWLDGVRADLEGENYASRAVDIPACSVDAPHIRQRLYWVATDLADAPNNRQNEGPHLDARREEDKRYRDARVSSEHLRFGSSVRDMADANVSGLRQRGWNHPPAGHGHTAATESRAGHWDDHVWLAGSDGKARRSKPGLPLLAYGVSNRVGRLRAYGNAIVPPLAAEVIRAFMECEP